MYDPSPQGVTSIASAQVFEWLYTLDEYKGDVMDSTMQTVKSLAFFENAKMLFKAYDLPAAAS